MAKKSPRRYEDFVAPNPFLKPWMVPYLPSNFYLQDVVIATAGIAGCIFVSIALYEMNKTIGEYISLPLATVGVGIFAGITHSSHHQVFFGEKNVRIAKFK